MTAEGAQFSVYAGHARSVEVCLFDRADDGTTTERRVPLRHRAHGTWFDTVPGVGAGQRYAFRVDGDWDPDRSLLHNPAKLLLDPYARAIEGEFRLDRAVFGSVPSSTLGESPAPYSTTDWPTTRSRPARST